MGSRRYRPTTVKQLDRSESQSRHARLVTVDASDCRQHIHRLMIMRELAIVIFAVRQLVTVVVNRNFVGVSVMVNVLDHRGDRLVMPRLMRTPHHARHDERANDQDEGEMTKHMVLLSVTASEGNVGIILGCWTEGQDHSFAL